jgi:hypothetical protein
VKTTIELPKYLCSACVDLLRQFKSFKDTCIQSDKHLQDAFSKSTSDDEDFVTELPQSPPPSPRRTRKARSKVENAKIKTSEEIPTEPKIEVKEETEPESSNKFDDLYEIYEISSAKNKKKTKKQPGKKRKILDNVDNVQKDIGIAAKEERKDESDDSEEWNLPLKKKVEQPKARRKTRKHRRFHCTIPKCQNKFVTEALLEVHLKAHEGIDVIFKVF